MTAAGVDRLAWRIVLAARATSETNLRASELTDAERDDVLTLLDGMDASNYMIAVGMLRAIVASPGLWTIH